MRSDVLSGVDPVAEKKLRRASKVDAVPTVGTVLDLYSELHLSKLKDGKRRLTALQSALKAKRGNSVAELSKSEIQNAIDSKAKTAPVAANRLRAYLCHFAGWARRRGYIEMNIGEDIDPPTKEKARERILSLEEVAAIWRATEQIDLLFGAFFRILILTAQRRSDVSGMRRDELKNGRWEIGGRTKNGRPHVVHLSAAAKRELDTVRSVADPESALVFTTNGSKPISGFGRKKRRLDELSGVGGWTLHDLRTAFATHCAEAGVSEGVVDRILNHAASASKASTVARIYQRSELLPQRAIALDLWANMVTLSRHPDDPSHSDDIVVQLRMANS
jgi:integrase